VFDVLAEVLVLSRAPDVGRGFMSALAEVPWWTPPANDTERSTITPWRWIDTVTRQLELCNAGAGESATVLGTDTGATDLREIFALSLERLGCQVTEVIVRSGALFDGADPIHSEPVALALTASDLVVDTSGDLVESSAARDEILDQSRVLAIDIVAVSDLDGLVAHPGLRKRLHRAEELLENGTALTIDSGAGTHLEMSLAGAEFKSSSGVVQEPGDIEHWPAGLVAAQPVRHNISGCVVAMPGDVIDQAGHLIRSPVRIEIENGLLTDVLGDSTDADIVRSHLEGLDDFHAFEVAEVGWGMNFTRAGSGLDLFDPARLAVGRGLLEAGRINIRTGGAVGGSRAGLALSLAGADLAIDDIELINKGALSGAIAPDVYERAASS
jgi:hypothetical protein